MKRSTIKEAFGGEVRFTKFIADNIDIATKLLDVVDMSMGDDYRVIPEDKTIDSKRVDLTVNDSDGTTVAVIESQDATGWLDTVHSSKIMYYMWRNNATMVFSLLKMRMKTSKALYDISMRIRHLIFG